MFPFNPPKVSHFSRGIRKRAAQEDDFEDNSRDFEDEGFEDEGFEDDAASGLGSEGDYSEAEKEG